MSRAGRDAESRAGRLGALLALTWGDVDFVEGLVHVGRTRSRGVTHAPKTAESVREADLTHTGVDLLAAWKDEAGEPPDDVLVFSGADDDGYIEPTSVLRVMYPGMKRADIPRAGRKGANRSFHSFRHTYAKRALEAGASVPWLQRQLGHSTITVTNDLYGHFERAGRRREVEKVESAPAVGY